jgi:hypothetical protein
MSHVRFLWDTLCVLCTEWVKLIFGGKIMFLLYFFGHVHCLKSLRCEGWSSGKKWETAVLLHPLRRVRDFNTGIKERIKLYFLHVLICRFLINISGMQDSERNSGKNEEQGAEELFDELNNMWWRLMKWQKCTVKSSVICTLRQMISSRLMRWAGDVARMGEMIKFYWKTWG